MRVGERQHEEVSGDGSDGAKQVEIEKLKDHPELRRAYIKQAVVGGHLREKGSPALVVNDETLSPAMRALVHTENQARAAVVTAAHQTALEKYCEAVESAPNAAVLRSLGAYTPPAALSEPGLTVANKGQWNFALTQTNFGLERANRAVGNRISDLRGENRAGSYGFEASVSASTKATALAASESLGLRAGTNGLKLRESHELGIGIGTSALLVNAETGQVKEKLKLEVPVGEKKAAVELQHDADKMMIAAKLGAPGVYVASNFKAAEVTAGLSVSAGVVTAKAGVTAQGITREYARDVGDQTQGGLFGAMAELDKGVRFESLSPQRQAWYARQGFDSKTYEHARKRAAKADED